MEVYRFLPLRNIKILKNAVLFVSLAGADIALMAVKRVISATMLPHVHILIASLLGNWLIGIIIFALRQ